LEVNVTTVLIIFAILVYGALGGVTMALLDHLYDADADDLGGATLGVFLLAPLVLAGIGGYELVMYVVDKIEK
jgi:hypothetical protein